MGSSGGLIELLHLSLDLAEQVAGFLPLAALAALQCTCRAGRAAVSKLPESLWQAAAEREFLAFHPMLQTPSVRCYLRQQHAMRSSFLHGRSPCEAVLHPACAAGSISPDFCKAASLAPAYDLQVLDSESGEQLCSWQLPALPAAVCPARFWGWDPTSRYIFLQFGDAWTHWSPAPPELSGMAFMDTHTGACPFVLLGHLVPAATDEVQTRAVARPCSDRGLVLVHQSMRWQIPVAFRVYDCEGRLVSILSTSAAAPSRDAWAPAGQGVALCYSSDSSMWVWHLATGAVQCISKAPAAYISWATPYSGSLLVVQGPSDPCCIVSLTQESSTQDVRQPLVAGSAPLQLGTARHHSVKWGSRIVMLVSSPSSVDSVASNSSLVSGVSCFSLQLVSLQGDSHVVQHTLTSDGRLFAVDTLQLSPCGEYCAVLLGTAERMVWEVRRTHLAVVHLMSGVMRTVPFSIPLVDDANVAWCPDSSAVLVIDVERHLKLFRF